MANQINSNLIYDLDEIKDFIFGNENDRNSEVEITETQVRNNKGKLRDMAIYSILKSEFKEDFNG